MKYDSYVNSFLEYILYELNYSKKTKNTYYQALKSYGKFLEEKKEITKKQQIVIGGKS